MRIARTNSDTKKYVLPEAGSGTGKAQVSERTTLSSSHYAELQENNNICDSESLKKLSNHYLP